VLVAALSCKQRVENGWKLLMAWLCIIHTKSKISVLCLYGAIQLCIKHMAGFVVSLELSPSLEQMEFCGNFLSKGNFSGILFGRLLARIAECSLNGSPRDMKFHNESIAGIFCFGAFADRNSGIVYHDLTGSFPFISFDGSVCFFVLYHYESNAILAKTITRLDNMSIFTVYKTYFEESTAKGFKPH
jgi:hypothetical protein